MKARADDVSASLEHCEQMGGVGEADQLEFSRSNTLPIRAPSKKQLRKSSFTLEGTQTVHPDLSIDGVGTATATRTIRFVFRRL